MMGLNITGFHSQYFYLDLKKDSEATFETYSDYYYSEGTRSLKIVTHEFVKTETSKGSYTKAYSMSGGSNVVTKGEDGKITEYKINNNLLNLSERSFERYKDFAETDTFIYTFAVENK